MKTNCNRCGNCMRVIPCPDSENRCKEHYSCQNDECPCHSPAERGENSPENKGIPETPVRCKDCEAPYVYCLCRNTVHPYVPIGECWGCGCKAGQQHDQYCPTIQPPKPEGEKKYPVEKDLETYGKAVVKDGQRIDPKEMHVAVEKAPADEFCTCHNPPVRNGDHVNPDVAVEKQEVRSRLSGKTIAQFLCFLEASTKGETAIWITPGGGILSPQSVKNELAAQKLRLREEWNKDLQEKAEAYLKKICWNDQDIQYFFRKLFEV